MDGFDPMNSFGPEVAAAYETHLRGDEDAAADFLAGLAGDGPALELAIGTGRIAFPLLERGVPVAGVDQSQAMLDGQVDVFRNAASRLADDGVFVIENLTPWESVPSSQFVHAESVSAGEVVLDVNRYDRATQLLSENHVRISADGIRMGPIEQRLTHPSELDLMARLAGLRLQARYAGWRREPFTGDSARHVSVYAR